MDPKTEVSLSSDTGNIILERKAIADGEFGVHAALSDGYDGIITLNIFPVSGATVQDYSWISLQVSAEQSSGRGGVSTDCLLGALNVVFVADATRSARFASPAAIQLNAARPKASTNVSANSVAALGDTVSYPGWWFRDTLGDTNNYPRGGVISHSPGQYDNLCTSIPYADTLACAIADIQPVGQTSDSNIVADIGTPNDQRDYSDTVNPNLESVAPNYIYLRGNCTLGDGYQVESRLFAVPNDILLTPSQYAAGWSVNDYDGHGNSTGYAMRPITSATVNSFNVVNDAFNCLNPPPPSNFNSDHYCLVAETRHPTFANPDPNWPHENTGDFATGESISLGDLLRLSLVLMFQVQAPISLPGSQVFPL
jgi:hypothetical protein